MPSDNDKNRTAIKPYLICWLGCQSWFCFPALALLTLLVFLVTSVRTLANNRIGETITNNATSTRAFAYDWANRLTSITSGSGTLTADHDANGNMTRLGSDYLGWNVRGQLALMTSGGQSSTFGYDLYNRRISKSVSGNSPRSYKWSGWRSHGGTGSGVFAKTTGVDNHASLGGNATITDHLGSVVTLLNNAGQVAQSNSFDPSGQTISSTNSNGFGF